MSNSTNNYSPDLVSFSIQVNGTTIPDEIAVTSINTSSKLNGKPKATIQIIEPNSYTSGVPSSTSALFSPGAKLTIKAGYSSNNQLIFTGMVTAQGIEINSASEALFSVECEGDMNHSNPSSNTSPVLTLNYLENILEMNARFLPNQLNNTLHGKLKFQGVTYVKPGTYVTISGVGDHFNGDHAVSKVVHTISGGTWITQATLGLPITPTKKDLVLEDGNGNSIRMTETGIQLKSPAIVSIEGDQQLVLNGNQGVTIRSNAGDVQTKGVNIKDTADMQYMATGSMNAKVEGGAELVLKGAMVMIN